MQISQEQMSARYYIRSYNATQIQINNQTYQHSLIVSPTQLIAPWTPQSFAQLTAADLQMLMDLNPEIILLGTGTIPLILPANLLHYVSAAHRSIETMDTGAACRTYNLLVNEGRKVVAGLIVEST